MRSLFWRILASFWLAIALVAGLSILLGHMLNQDAWILSRHPGLSNLAQEWTQLYEAQGEDAAQDLLQQRKRQYHIDVQVLNESGEPVVRGTSHAVRPRSKRARTTTRTATCPGAG